MRLVCPKYAPTVSMVNDEVVMWLVNHSALVCGRGGCNDVTATSPMTSRSEQVELDLLHGIVKGYSRQMEFVVTPTPTNDRACSAQAVLRSNYAHIIVIIIIIIIIISAVKEVMFSVMSVCLSVCLSICLFVYLLICLSARLLKKL